MLKFIKKCRAEQIWPGLVKLFHKDLDFADIKNINNSWIGINGCHYISAHCTICAIYKNLVCCICCSSKVTTLVFRSCVTNTYEQFIQSLSTLYIYKKNNTQIAFSKSLLKIRYWTHYVVVFILNCIFTYLKKKLKDYDKCKRKVNCFTS